MNSRLQAASVRLSILLGLVAMLPMWLEILCKKGLDPYYTVPARSIDLVRGISLAAFVMALSLLVVGRNSNRGLLAIAVATLSIAFLIYAIMPHNWVVEN